ncbi:hypothetical protein K435DRAFT_623247, partial [Dendrothele bispora CBS 962.96]
SFKIELPSNLKARGVHPVFHASLLRIHIPNDDRLFPGRSDSQILNKPDEAPEKEWLVQEILSHIGSKELSTFEILWKSGDKSWLPYDRIAHLNALQRYLDLLGV